MDPFVAANASTHDASGIQSFNIREAAAFLGAHEQTVRRLARRGAIPCFKVGRDWRFRPSALQQWVEAQQPRPDAGRVLIVDDDEKLCAALRRVLERLGHRVYCATDGLRGLELADRERPAVILLDLVMPSMNGAQFLEELRKTQPELPVVIVTAFAEGDLLTRAMRFAPVLLLEKPITCELLERTVRAVIGGSLTAGRATVAT